MQPPRMFTNTAPPSVNEPTSEITWSEKTRCRGCRSVFAEPCVNHRSTKKPKLCQGHSLHWRWYPTKSWPSTWKANPRTRALPLTKERLIFQKPKRQFIVLRPRHPWPLWTAAEVAPRTPIHCEAAPNNVIIEVEFVACLHWFACLHQWQHQLLQFRHPFVSFLLIGAPDIIRLLLGAGIRSSRRHIREMKHFPTWLRFRHAWDLYTSTKDDVRKYTSRKYTKFVAKCWGIVVHEMPSQEMLQPATGGVCLMQWADASALNALPVYDTTCRPGPATATIRRWRHHANLLGWLRVLSATVACLQLTGKWPTYHTYN